MWESESQQADIPDIQTETILIISADRGGKEPLSVPQLTELQHSMKRFNLSHLSQLFQVLILSQQELNTPSVIFTSQSLRFSGPVLAPD